MPTAINYLNDVSQEHCHTAADVSVDSSGNFSVTNSNQSLSHPRYWPPDHQTHPTTREEPNRSGSSNAYLTTKAWGYQFNHHREGPDPVCPKAPRLKAQQPKNNLDVDYMGARLNLLDSSAAHDEVDHPQLGEVTGCTSWSKEEHGEQVTHLGRGGYNHSNA
ncbi:hypothetical protein BKA66DRAFT_575984 [Pyrenochaeta sp. MPI-SDFR-AT-0127]|nr:hypothetical protein BKA66DRAFT_575984 [Pyrenochaeta sp. MPI-SDFR-AT-0127]